MLFQTMSLPTSLVHSRQSTVDRRQPVNILRMGVDRPDMMRGKSGGVNRCQVSGVRCSRLGARGWGLGARCRGLGAGVILKYGFRIQD